MSFKIISEFVPTGDQPDAIIALTEGVNRGDGYQTLLGVTGSGKTFTIANVIERVEKPTLILSHNKTLAAQLYGEFRQFFPNNLVEYFVSYYDYYQPEAYMPVTDTYIEKDLSINEEIEKLRLSATSALLSGRRDIVVVSSVSCLYGIGNPDDFHNGIVYVKKGQMIPRNQLLRQLVESLYARNEVEFKRGTFRVRGEILDICLPYNDVAYRITFFGDEVEDIWSFDPQNGHKIEDIEVAIIYPANIFLTSKDRTQQAIREIQDDMMKQVEFFKSIDKHQEARRLEDRVVYDLEMIRELGYCSGIENYSRYFDGRKAGSRPFCLIDYFPDDFLMVIDESHVTISQIKAMWGGDHSRKQVLIDYGFRLPSASDNRPLKFEEFDLLTAQTIYVSATPGDFELEKCKGVFVDQLIRPTGVLDPIIDVRPSLNQIDDLIGEINKRALIDERVLVTTLTKRMAEELTDYLTKMGVRCEYVHSDVDTLDRVRILEELRNGLFDVLIGVNLLREGLDLPQVSLVAILDADKEGFLRSERSLTQTAGRAARNVNGRVIMYADKITNSMRRTIDETNRRREKQLKYNAENNITPTQARKQSGSVMPSAYINKLGGKAYVEAETIDIAADPLIRYMDKKSLQKLLDQTKKKMDAAAKQLDFIEAARYRDEFFALQKLIEK